MKKIVKIKLKLAELKILLLRQPLAYAGLFLKEIIKM